MDSDIDMAIYFGDGHWPGAEVFFLREVVQVKHSTMAESSQPFSASPQSNTSGGKTNLIGFSRYVANKRLRAVLIKSAISDIYRIKEPKTPKDKWLMSMVGRAG